MTKSSEELRRDLVRYLRRRRYLTDPRVIEAFLAVPRELFLPDHVRIAGLGAVYEDEAIVVRRDPDSGAPRSSSSQPAIMAVMLEMLDVRPGMRVLEIGAGTGYNAALLDHLTGPGGSVVTVDVCPETAGEATAALRRAGSSASVVVADGRVPLPFRFGFERMEITASSDEVPRAWFHQLVPGGRLVVPLRLSADLESTHAVTAFRRTDVGFDSVVVAGGGFMPLRPPSEPSEPASGGWTAPEAPEAPEVPRAPTTAPGAHGPARPALGPPLNLSREDLGSLRVTVGYADEPPDGRWVFERSDHWITVDVARGPSWS